MARNEPADSPFTKNTRKGTTDLRVAGRYAITMGSKGVVTDPLIEIEGHRIKSIDSKPGSDADIRVDGIILPGLISTHTHLHGLVAYGHPIPPPAGFWPFLKEWWWPLVEDVLTAEDVESLAAYAALLHLKSGYTCFCDVMEAPYAAAGFMMREAQAIAATGARALVSNEATERAGSEIAEKLLDENAAILYLKGRVQGLMSVHTTFSCSGDYIRKAKDIAREKGSLFQLHLSEGTYHVQDTQERFGKRPVPYLDDLGVLDEMTIASQSVHLEEEEIAILAERKVSVSHNPISNMEIGTGAAPVAQMLESGVNVTLGDDGFVRAFDPFVNMSTTFLLHALTTGGGDVSAQNVLSFLTTNAARALQLEAGSIEEGNLADLVLLEDSSPAPLIPENTIYHTVLGAASGDVRAVIVDGQVVLDGGVAQLVDEEQLKSRAMHTIRRLWKGSA
jgi:5-methylthioadenosine/S-adenosylhomocysteine deaminase